MPYDAEAGVYSLEVEVSNEDLTMSEVKQIAVENELPGSVIKSGNSLILVNPTNKLKVYSVIPEGSATASENVVVVPAGSSRTVTVNSASKESFSVSVLSGETLLGQVEFTGSESGASSAVIVLTIILAIIFIVLLVALIVLVTKKPEKEEFGESYY
jgi:preprotein translocase subunit SecG